MPSKENLNSKGSFIGKRHYLHEDRNRGLSEEERGKRKVS